MVLVLVLKKYGGLGLGLGLGLETQSLGLGLGLDKSLIYITEKIAPCGLRIEPLRFLAGFLYKATKPGLSWLVTSVLFLK